MAQKIQLEEILQIDFQSNFAQGENWFRNRHNQFKIGNGVDAGQHSSWWYSGPYRQI